MPLDAPFLPIHAGEDARGGAWPVTHAADRAALEAIARTLGARLSETGARSPGPAVRAGDARVIALSSAAAGAAELYGALVDRPVTAWRTGVDVRPGDVVVADAAALTYDLVTGALATPGVGIVAAWTPAELRRQVLVRSAAWYLSASTRRPPGTASRVDVYSVHPIARIDLPDRTILGDRAPADEIIDGLTRGADYLFLQAHSDGVDFYLRDELVGCGLGHEDASGPPRCHTTGWCHRLRVPTRSKEREERVFHPGRLAARVLVFDACFGLYFDGRPFGSRWGAGWAVAQSPTVATALLNFEMSVSGTEEAQSLATALQRHTYTGDAVREFLEGCPVPRRMLLFGDPHTVLPGSCPPPRPEASAPFVPVRTGGGAEPRRSPTDAFQFSVQTIREARPRLGPLPPLEPTDEDGEAFFDAFSRFPSLYRRWERQAELVDWLWTDCPCGLRATSRIWRLAGDPPHTRVTTICPRCGPTQDLPVPGPLASLRLDADGFRLVGASPRAGLLLVREQGDLRTELLAWPGGAATLAVDLGSFEGPLNVHLALLTDRGPGVLTTMLDGAAGRSARVSGP